MNRKIWQDDFAGFWLGGRRVTKTPDGVTAVDDQRLDQGRGRATKSGLGIVERNRLARREKWALRLGDN